MWKEEADTVDQIAQGPQVNYVYKDIAGHDINMKALDSWVTDMMESTGLEHDEALVQNLGYLNITAVFRSGDKTTSQPVSASDPLVLLTAKQQLLEYRGKLNASNEWTHRMSDYVRAQFNDYSINLPRFKKTEMTGNATLKAVLEMTEKSTKKSKKKRK